MQFFWLLRLRFVQEGTVHSCLCVVHTYWQENNFTSAASLPLDKKNIAESLPSGRSCLGPCLS